MTQQEYLDKVLLGLRSVEESIFDTKILDLAYEIATTEDYSEENYDRLGLLVDCYRSRHLGLIDEIHVSLLWAEKYFRLLLENQDIV